MRGCTDVTALTVLDTYLSQIHSASPSAEIATSGSSTPSPSFVYISAADAFRPLIPARYLETKREAEAGIALRCAERADKGVRGIYMRPGQYTITLILPRSPPSMRVSADQQD